MSLKKYKVIKAFDSYVEGALVQFNEADAKKHEKNIVEVKIATADKK